MTFLVKGILILTILTFGCSSRPSNEIEALSSDVLKHNEGIEIDVKPIAKTK